MSCRDMEILSNLCFPQLIFGVLIEYGLFSTKLYHKLVDLLRNLISRSCGELLVVQEQHQHTSEQLEGFTLFCQITLICMCLMFVTLFCV